MEELQEAIALALEKWKEEYGELEDGDEFVTAFNNCTLVISLENGKFKTNFICGRPYEVDMTISIYGGDGDAD